MPLFLALVLALVQGRSALAHDIWLQADRFNLEQGDTLVLRQLVGEELGSDLSRPEKTVELALLRDLTTRFVLIADQDSVDLLGELPDMRTEPNVKPVLKRRLDFEGLALVAMDHAIIYTEFDTDEFFEYLKHEGFDREGFEQHMGSRPVQTEGYQRTLKTLVQVGKRPAPASEIYRQVLGQELEMVLVQNPYALDPGDDLDVRVLFRSEPLSGLLVKAYNGDGQGPVSEHLARTGADGIARFNLAKDGLWLIRLVHLIPCTGSSRVDCEDAAWESYWTAYSFELD